MDDGCFIDKPSVQLYLFVFFVEGRWDATTTQDRLLINKWYCKTGQLAGWHAQGSQVSRIERETHAFRS